MTYLAPHFDPDVFVSYSHGDPRGGGASPLRDWTHALVERLVGQILSLDDEFDDLRLWIDKQFDPTAQLTTELRAKASASGVLMIVMSKRYLGSSWCRDELEWFRKQIQDRGAEGGRVFIIRAQQTDPNAWPDFLRDERGHAMPGFTFYDPASGIPLGWEDLQAPDFRRALSTLQTALINRLRELRERAARREQAAPAPPPISPGPRNIYLHAPAETAQFRADIERELTGEGIVTLPVGPAQSSVGRRLAVWNKEAAQRREMASRCEALALLRPDDDGRFLGDLVEIGLSERDRIKEERGWPLPCAVFDRTGANPPVDMSVFGIKRFDLNRYGWKSDFRAWLDAERAQPAQARP